MLYARYRFSYAKIRMNYVSFVLYLDDEKKEFSLNGPLNSTIKQKILLETHTLDISFAYSDRILVVHHLNSENEELQFLMYILGCIREGVLFENKRFAYLDSSASTSAIWIISKFYRFLTIGGVKKAPFLYQVFPKVKSIFTPGVATRLAVVTYSHSAISERPQNVLIAIQPPPKTFMLFGLS